MKFCRRFFIVSILIVILSFVISAANAQGCFSWSLGEYDEGQDIDPWQLNQELSTALLTSSHGYIEQTSASCTGEFCDYQWIYTVEDGNNQILNAQIYRDGRCIWNLSIVENNVAPDATFEVVELSRFVHRVNINDVTDVQADMDAGFHYEYDCDVSDGIIDLYWFEDVTHDCEYQTHGTYHGHVRVYDKDFNGDYSQTWEDTFAVVIDAPPPPPPPTDVTPEMTPEVTETVVPPTEITETVEPPAETPMVTPDPIVTAEVTEYPEYRDTDGDGMPDEDDACPWQGNEGGLGIDETGCPYYDADWDGIYDRDDTCPWQGDEYGQGIDVSGCPIPEPFETQEVETTQESSEPESTLEASVTEMPVSTEEVATTPEVIITEEPEVTESP